ncbi:hypothetical protein [Planococcus salinarum]|uniref:hypothetical protein n=1 Tax=Planococcus salinarum TaxID=622695 RepID=UPI000E3C96EB|nr:hypothetical protein [Planococcus salinarum]TAA72792.1 hypothetical protein D2909_04165 [Planococcus salinarum]
MKEEKNKKHQTEDEATQANLEIQEHFEDDKQQHDETSSPVPFVANNTAPLTPRDKNKKK